MDHGIQFGADGRWLVSMQIEPGRELLLPYSPRSHSSKDIIANPGRIILSLSNRMLDSLKSERYNHLNSLEQSRSARINTPRHNDVSATIIYTHAMNRSGRSVKSLLDERLK